MTIFAILINIIQSSFVISIGAGLHSLFSAGDIRPFDQPLMHCVAIGFYVVLVLVIAGWVWT